MTISSAGRDYICINFGNTNLCCVASGLSWYYTAGGVDYPETGGTAQIVSRLASGLIDSLTMTSPPRGTFTQSDLNNANTQTVTITDAQTITDHDELSEDQWCYTPTNGDASNLSGQITDTETSLPISNATIKLNSYIDTSDINGFYFIPSIPSGTYNFTVSAPAYTTHTDTILISEGDNYYDASLSSTTTFGDIKGRVLDRFDNPVVNAKAVIIETGQFDYTDSEGYFVITSVPIGTHTIEISKENYDFEYITVDIAEGFNELTEPVTLYRGWIPEISPAMMAGVAALAGIIGSIVLKR